MQNNFIATEAYIQTQNAASTSSCVLGHNDTSTMSEEQMDKLNGTTVPADQEANPSLLLAEGNKYGLSINMSTDEYQDLYD
mgnify:CR=1 FL=1